MSGQHHSNKKARSSRAVKSWTQAREALFLDVVRRTGNISAAARAAKVSRTAVYKRKRIETDFSEALQNALEEAVDELEAELRRRALDGVEKPVFYGGKQCGAVQTYSDNLGMFLLKGRRRSVFGDGKGTSKEAVMTEPDVAQSAMDELLEKLDAMTPPQLAAKSSGP